MSWLTSTVICWGICVAATATCKSFASLMVLRFLLGMFEAVVAPT